MKKEKYTRAPLYICLSHFQANAFSYGSKDGRELNLSELENLLYSVKKLLGNKGRIFFGSFPSEVRPEHVTEETLLLAKQYINNDNLIIGVQTGSKSLLDSIPIISFALSISLFALGFKQDSQIITICGSIFLAFVPLYLYFANIRQKHYLSTIAVEYVEKNPERIDEILGVLINKKTSNFIVDRHPIDRLFEAIKKQIVQKDVEMQRRVAEALPSLYHISEKRYWEIVETMIVFYDVKKWKSDIRRRVIESLSYAVEQGTIKKDVFNKLSFHLGDEPHTQIAIIEVLSNILTKYKTKKMYVQKVNECYNSLLQNNENELNAIWNVLEKIRNKNLTEAEKELWDFAKSTNMMLQMFASRNFRLLCTNGTCYENNYCGGNYELAVKYITEFLNDNKHKYVRRPISKENSLDCLCCILNRNKTEKIKSIFWKLFDKKQDYMIRRTSFDKITKIYNIDEDFALKITDYIIENGDRTKKTKPLLDRAKRFKADVTKTHN